MEFNPDVFINPQKYSRPIATEKIVADKKFSSRGVEYYKKKIEANEPIDPIIVVKHPTQDAYAVLDGHHRYYAYKELGKHTINCALVEDYSSVVFYLTEHGYLQPSAVTTEHLRAPTKRMHANLKQFLTAFLDEDKIKQEMAKRKAEQEALIKRLKEKTDSFHLK